MNNPIIKVNQVSKKINDTFILEGITFEVTEGTLVAIVGPNGAGKTTLVNIILGIDTDFSGSVIIEGPKEIGFIPQITMQDHYSLPMSVHEYMSIGATTLYHKNRSEVSFVDALAHVGVSDEIIHQPIHTLSGGERQRVAIARALLSNPRILVLDEPLAAVDYASRKDLYELIAHLTSDHGITVILVSHDVEYAVPMSDQVLCLDRTLHQQCHISEETSHTGNAIIHNHELWNS